MHLPVTKEQLILVPRLKIKRGYHRDNIVPFFLVCVCVCECVCDEAGSGEPWVAQQGKHLV